MLLLCVAVVSVEVGEALLNLAYKRTDDERLSGVNETVPLDGREKKMSFKKDIKGCRYSRPSGLHRSRELSRSLVILFAYQGQVHKVDTKSPL